MTDPADFRARLEVIAFALGRYTPFDTAGRYAMWAELRVLAVGERPRFGPGIPRRSTLDGWFGEGRMPQGDNRYRLALCLREYAAAHDRHFEEEWLALPLAALAEAMDVDLDAFHSAREQAARAVQSTTVALPFRVAPDRSVKLREKYAGKYYAYRFHAARDVLIREVLLISTQTDNGIGTGLMTDYQFTPYSVHIVPTYHSLAFYMFEGQGGDGFRAEAMVMRRKKGAKRAFAAIRTKLSESVEQQLLAVKVLLFKQDTAPGPLPTDQDALDALHAEGSTFGPETDTYARLAPWLAIDPGTERSGYRDFGRHALWIDAGEVLNQLEDLDGV